jgi:hypothetical protein
MSDDRPYNSKLFPEELIDILFENTVFVARDFNVSILPPFLFPSQGKFKLT